MKKELLSSLGVHLLIVTIILFFSSSIAKVKGYPNIYRVNLVTLPKVTIASASEIRPLKTEKPQVAFKPLKKLSKKELSPQKQVLEDLKKEKLETSKKETDTNQTVGSAVLEGEGLEKSYYVDLFLQKIKEAWRNPVRGGQLKATVYFKILKDGKIVEAKIEGSSGVSIFDLSALRAVISCSPLPPLPSNFTQEYLGVHLEFEYSP